MVHGNTFINYIQNPAAFMQLLSSLLSFTDCVVTENKQESDKSNVITVRLQGKEKASVQEYSLQKVCTVHLFGCFCEIDLVLNCYCSFFFKECSSRVNPGSVCLWFERQC